MYILYFVAVVAFSLIFVVSTDDCESTAPEINYESHHGLMNGLIFPSVIDAVVGENIFFKITEPVAQQTQCFYRMTGGIDVDVKAPKNPNLDSWTEETCGLRISKITEQDKGFWRLTSKNTTDVTKGIVFINVRSEVSKPQMKTDIDSFDVNITPDYTSYCYVLRPDESKTVFPHHENCNFPKFNSDSEATGIWQIVSGVKGKTNEVSFEVNVKANVEQIESFVDYDANTLKMKCKLVHSKKVMKFCRFLRFVDDVGYNLEEGQGDLRYRYYGTGFKDLECGIAITNPTGHDKTPWKCFIGYEETDTMHTVGAIIDATDPRRAPIQAPIKSEDVYGLENNAVNILCTRNAPTDYCWFQDPSGHKISLSDQNSHEDDIYRYYGTGIKLGECGITILNATHNHSGTWSCHMGATHIAETDAMREISVRITQTALVSTNLVQDAEDGTSLLLECRSVPKHVPIDYCRFVLPDGTGFSVNEQTTSANPHMNNYYFNPNRKLKSGYCAIVVERINQKHHHGEWTCAARLLGGDKESSDEFRVSVYKSNVAVASITGMLFMAAILIGGLIIVTFTSYRRKYSLRRPTRQTIISYVTGSDRVSIASDDEQNSQTGRYDIELRAQN